MKLEGSLININGMKLSQLSKYLPIKRAVNCYDDLSCTFRLELRNFVVSNIFEENKFCLLCVDCLISLIYLKLGQGKPIDQLIFLGAK
jgi:hypothetical protein